MKNKHDIITYAKNGDCSMLRRALEHGVDPNCKDEEGWTPLHWAAQEAHLEIVLCLIAFGAEVNSTDKLGFTALALAVGEGHDAIVRVLLDAGASANQIILGNEGGTVMHLACAWNRMEAVTVLMDCSDVDINVRDETGKTPLAYAIEQGHDELATYLIKHGATT